MLTIAVCGNHQVVYCTESELVWTLRQMGHTVIPFQENKTTTNEMLAQSIAQQVQLFIYVHTHTWKTPGTITFDDLIAGLRAAGIKTASFHLDLYWGLDKGDQRQSRVGTHPFWHTDKVFTADGGHQTEFESRKVDHYWLPPAIAARHCFKGTYRSELASDVAFAGAKGYHEEYPFRGELIHWLEKTYGPRFRRFGSGTPDGVVREAKLNDVYASVKVVVGDSCLSGTPYYWSDRVPETLGRGGFLIHPKVTGLDIPGLVTFEPRNLSQLKIMIDYYLGHEAERQKKAQQAMKHVTKHHTYTNRMQVLLGVMGLS